MHWLICSKELEKPRNYECCVFNLRPTPNLSSSFALFQVVDRAVASQPEAPDAKERAEKFSNKFRLRLSVLKQQPA